MAFRGAPPLVQQVDERCRLVVNDVVGSGRYAAFNVVLPMVLDSLRVPSLAALGIPDVQSVPCLAYLWRFEREVHSFVTGFAATRSIATYADLAVEVVATLRSFCIEPLHEYTPHSSSRHRLQQGEQQGEQAEQQATTFESFGVGPLSMFPAVQRCFGEGVARRSAIARSSGVPGPAEVNAVAVTR